MKHRQVRKDKHKSDMRPDVCKRKKYLVSLKPQTHIKCFRPAEQHKGDDAH